ncbi:MAG: NAD(P)H-hydrate dehydratase [Methanosarcinales archaeon]|nr:NAD(P)H-hydrate dehydratase [Methanosarcinales archaeon]
MKQETITAEEMKAIDKNAVGLGMHPLQLMENAGAAVADVVLKHTQSQVPSVLLFAGLGNNGGDAFVAARHLSNSEKSAVLFLIGDETQIKTQESQINFKLMKQTGKVTVFEIKSESDLSDTYARFRESADIIVDGIFGTGFSGKPKGLEKAAITLINSEKEKRNLSVFSIDIPSGMPPAGFKEGAFDKDLIIKADATITFHKMKTFLKTKEAEEYAGGIFVRAIGIPANAEKYIGPGDVLGLYKRAADNKKGESGKILVIAGGPYAGAPAFAGMGAYRTGSDIVTIAAPETICKTISSFAPEFIVRKLPGNLVSEEDVPILTELIRTHDVTVLGPGFGYAPESVRAAALLAPSFKKAIIDADALVPEILEAIVRNKNSAEIIITPHYRELKRTAAHFEKMIPDKRQEVSDDALEAVLLEINEKLGATVLLKGPEDMIADGGEVRYNSTGNAGMSVGGTGDVLAGIVGSLLARNSTAAAAGCCAYICGKAGDLAYASFGDSLIPTDLIDCIPFVFPRDERIKNTAGKQKNKKRSKKQDQKIK